MNIYNGFDKIEFRKDTILTVGTFDGVHLGHQRIIKHLLESAESRGMRAVIFTLDPHPQIVLHKPGKPPVKLLTMIEERLKVFEQFGVEHVLIIPFTFEFSRTSPEIFVKELLAGKVGMKKILIGYDHMFGKDRAGDENLLRNLSEELDFEIEKIDPLNSGDITVSSTKIRKALNDNEIEKANAMLGYTYFAKGKVVRGDGRGAKIGVPTANIEVSKYKQMPGNGVYLVRSTINGRQVFGMSNIGSRPTFTNDVDSILEINYFDFDFDLYDMEIEVEFLNFIRREKKFDGLDSFLAQLSKDKNNCEDLIKRFYI